jgi:hypothetical protein
MPRAFVLVLPVVLFGCSAFLPHRPDRISEAREKESAVCPRGGAPDYPSGLFERGSVTQVEPIYSSVRTGRSGNESRLQGARLKLRPIAGMTTTSLEALLICHQARRVLGRGGEVELQDDPYWLPNSWLDIGVDSEAGNFVVSLRARNITEANELLSRAEAFAAHAASSD